MPETVYNFTVADTSPMIAYSPYVAADATTGGWASNCPTSVTDSDGQKSFMCDPDSAHSTSSYKASFQLSFNGVGIYLMGDTTNSLGYDITLDGVHFPGNPKPDLQLLYSAVDLAPGKHTISLTVRQPALSSNPGSVTFKEAIVTAGTGLTGALLNKGVIDDGDQRIVYDYPPGGNWTVAPTYPQSVGPIGVASTTFHESYVTDATATLNFQGTGVFAYGACYSHSRFAAYSASVDGAAEIPLDGTVNLYSATGVVKQRAGNCLRYYQTGLDGSKDHTLVLRVKEPGRLAVDWIEVVTVSGGTASDNGGGGSGGSSNAGTSSKSNSSMTGILAGAISGGVVLILALLALAICLRRRRRNKRVEPEREKDFNEAGPPTGYVTTPYNPGPHPQVQYSPMPITPPWPQPQSPAPQHYLAAGMGPMGPGNRTSVASSGAPLVSPGAPSTYSGWSSGHGSSYNNHAPSAESSGFNKMAAYNNMANFDPNSGSNMAVEGGGSSSRFDASSLRPSTMSPGPPAYDHGEYMSPAPGSAKGQRL